MIARLVAAFVLCLACSASWAQVTLSRFPPNPGVLPGGGWKFTTGTTFGDPPPPRAWVNGVYGGVPKFVAQDSMVLAGRAGALPVVAATSIGLGDAAVAVGRCIIGANPICALGTAAYLAYKAYRAMPPDSDPYVCGGVPCSFPSLQFDYDPGVDPTPGGTVACRTWRVANNSAPQLSGCWPDVGGAPDTASAISAARALGGTRTNYESGVGVVESCAVTAAPTMYSATRFSFPATGADSLHTACAPVYGGGSPIDTNGTSTTSTSASCPASTDPFNPAYNVPAGSPVGPDGKCPTARYNHVPQTPEQIAARVVANPPSFPSAQWGQGVGDAIDSGGQTAPGTVGVTGPATQTGAPTTETTTGPSGTVTKTTTPTYTYNYAGDTITYNETNTTTVNNNGSVTTTVTTGGAATPQDPKDPCTADPNRVGCVKLGDIPTDKPGWTTKEIVYTPEVLSLPSACPAPWSAHLFKWDVSMSYQIACDQAPAIRLAVLALAGFGCLFFIVRSVVK